MKGVLCHQKLRIQVEPQPADAVRGRSLRKSTGTLIRCDVISQLLSFPFHVQYKMHTGVPIDDAVASFKLEWSLMRTESQTTSRIKFLDIPVKSRSLK